MTDVTIQLFQTTLTSVIAPMTLVGGVAFLTSILANRYGRCIDRIRGLIREIKALEVESKTRAITERQLTILYYRTRALKVTMTMAALSIVGIVFTVFGAFATLFFGFHGTYFVIVAFVLALLLLIASLFGLIRDILISLKAVELEIRTVYEPPVQGIAFRDLFRLGTYLKLRH